MVSENCIYFMNETKQIYLDFGESGGCRDLYLYDNGECVLSAYFYFYNGLLLITNKYNLFEKPFCWEYQKNDEYSIKINGDVYYIDKTNEKQTELLNKLLQNIFD